MRFASLLIPLFPLAARLRSEPDLRAEALAVVEGNGTTARIVAATRPARGAGIRAGQTLAQARARLPDLIARVQDQECERAAQEALCEVAEAFSPRIEDRGDGQILLDLDGLERLFPNEEDLARSLQVAADREGLPIWVGIAGSRLAARLAAGRPPSPTVISAGQELEFLAPLPLSQLTPAIDTATRLASWGIRSIGDLARLPRHEVASRLGPEGRRLQALARGLDPRPLIPRRPPLVFREGLEMEWPLVHLEAFLFAVRGALERLARRLEARGLACRRLELSLELEPDGHDERALELPAPTREVRTLLTLLRLDLERRSPGAPIRAFALSAHPDRAPETQLSLLGPAALSPDRLATTLARLFALLGPQRVGSPRPIDRHRPGDFQLVPFAPPPPPRIHREPRAGRGLLAVRTLRPPLPVEVLVDGGQGGPPATIRSLACEEDDKRLSLDGRIRIASGPWTMEEAWWSEDPVDREYWDVELASGLYRIFRNRADGDWYADGVYD